MDHRTQQAADVQHDSGTDRQHDHESPRKLRIKDLDGACYELADRDTGLALVVGEELSIVEFHEPIPYRLATPAPRRPTGKLALVRPQAIEWNDQGWAAWLRESAERVRVRVDVEYGAAPDVVPPSGWAS